MITSLIEREAKVGAAVLPVCERLEKRALLAGNTVVDAGMLTVYGTDGDDNIVVTVDSSSAVSVVVNGASAGTFTGLTGLRVSARGGNDLVQLDDASGALAATLVGGDGADTLRGGANGDWLYGSAGDDLLCGNAGNDFLIGGEGMDTFDGGLGFNSLSMDAIDETAYFGDFDTAEELADAPGFALDPAPEPEPVPEPTPEPEPVCKPGNRWGHYKNGKAVVAAIRQLAASPKFQAMVMKAMSKGMMKRAA